MADNDQIETPREQRMRLFRAAQRCGVSWQRYAKNGHRSVLGSGPPNASQGPATEVFRWIAHERVERAAATLYCIDLTTDIARHATAAERAAFIAGAYWEMIYHE